MFLSVVCYIENAKAFYSRCTRTTNTQSSLISTNVVNSSLNRKTTFSWCKLFLVRYDVSSSIRLHFLANMLNVLITI